MNAVVQALRLAVYAPFGIVHCAVMLPIFAVLDGRGGVAAVLAFHREQLGWVMSV